MAGLVVLLVKQGVGGTAPWVAGGLVLVGALAGLVYGAARRIDRRDTARVADRAFGLHDRVATTLEWAERADRTPLVEALVADTRARVEALQMKRVVRHELPREARFLPLPLLACLVLALMPLASQPTLTWLEGSAVELLGMVVAGGVTNAANSWVPDLAAYAIEHWLP